MNNFIFENATKVYFGRGCVKEYLACLTKNCKGTLMLAYGQGSIKKNGIYEEVTGILEAAGKHIIEFPGIMPNPTYAKVLEGANLAKENQVEMILGIGGGSVTDCCKAVAAAAQYEGDAWEDFWEHPGYFDFEPLALGIISTTAGSGSECNGRAIITNEEKKVKISRDYPKCSPRFALLDPTYTYSMPKAQFISGSFAILSYIIEIYFSGPDENSVSDDMAESLMKNIIVNLRRASKEPKDYRAVSDLMWDAVMAQNGMLQLGKRMDFEYCQRERKGKFKQFAINVWGISPEGKTEDEIAFAGIKALEDFKKEIGFQKEKTTKNERRMQYEKNSYALPGIDSGIWTLRLQQSKIRE